LLRTKNSFQGKQEWHENQLLTSLSGDISICPTSESAQIPL
jgi:hypothetical protein